MIEPELTEQEWLAGIDLGAMLNHLILESNRRSIQGDGTAEGANLAAARSASERKPRLFACQCCLHIWNLLEDGRSRRAVEVAGEFIEGRSTSKLLSRARRAARQVFLEPFEAVRQACIMPREQHMPWRSRRDLSLPGTPQQRPTWLCLLSNEESSQSRSWTLKYRHTSASIPPGLSTVAGFSTSSVIHSTQSLLMAAGNLQRSSPSLRRSMTNEPSTAFRSWPMPWKKPAARTPTPWTTVVDQDHM
jgi:hypothetical protein